MAVKQCSSAIQAPASIRIGSHRAFTHFLRMAKRLPHLSLRVHLTLAIIAILLGSSLAYNRSLAATQNRARDFSPFPLASVTRLMVVAPHPDDETLAAGGLIQSVLEQGGRVRVVMMTNGDGQALSPLVLNRRLFPHSADYISVGELRQLEAARALQELGVSPEWISFLGYPDRGLMQLWLDNWETNCPRRTAFTQSTASPYPNTFNPGSDYCGKNVLNDLRTLIEEFNPDSILVSHPNDDHTDHRAAANFVQLAISLVKEQFPEYLPQVWAYPIHYGYFPLPRGDVRNAYLVPPTPLMNESVGWEWLDLSPELVERKASALNFYASQNELLGKFMYSFTRRNEIFIPLHDTLLSTLEFNEKDLLEQDAGQLSTSREPSKESMRRYLVGGADLTGWKFARFDKHLLIIAETRGPLVPGLHYRIRIKTQQGKTHTYSVNLRNETLAPSSFVARVDLEELGNPSVLAVSAEILQGAVLDRTGWSILRLVDHQSGIESSQQLERESIHVFQQPGVSLVFPAHVRPGKQACQHPRRSACP